MKTIKRDIDTLGYLRFLEQVKESLSADKKTPLQDRTVFKEMPYYTLQAKVLRDMELVENSGRPPRSMNLYWTGREISLSLANEYGKSIESEKARVSNMKRNKRISNIRKAERAQRRTIVENVNDYNINEEKAISFLKSKGYKIMKPVSEWVEL